MVYESYTKILSKIDLDMAKQVAHKVNGIVPDVRAEATPKNPKSSATLSQLYYAPKSPIIATRRIAVLIADGFNEPGLQAVRATLARAKALNFIIGPRRGQVYPAGKSVGAGEGLEADFHYESARSTLFDAIFVPAGAAHAQTLANNGRAVHWVREAFGHCKPIGAIGEGEPLYPRSSRVSWAIG